MTIQWEYRATPTVGVVSLSGHLGEQAIDRFAGAIGWAFARGAGPIIVDLGGLQSWSDAGREAVVDAAKRLAVHGRSLDLAGWPSGRQGLTDCLADQVIRHYPDVQAALSANAATDSRTEGP